MAKYEVGPTGQLLQGHLYDVNKHSFMRAVNDYDSHLYLAWNPKKRRGLGCWELRRRPEKKTAIYCGEFDGMHLFQVDPIENNIIHHVMDLPFLSYNEVAKLKQIDTWNDKYWLDGFEAKEAANREKHEKAIRSELRYNLKQDRTVFRVFKEMVASGVNPALLAQHWGQGPN